MGFGTDAMTWPHRMGLRWASWQIRRRDLFTVDIRSALSRGGKALIFLPNDEELVSHAVGACRHLSVWFEPTQLMILSPSENPPTAVNAGLPVLAVPHAVNRWGLPYRPVIRRVTEIAPQVAISLHPSFDLASAYLCVVSGAPLRIGIGGGGDRYFNLRYVWRDANGVGAPEHYRSFVRMLADLRRSAV